MQKRATFLIIIAHFLITSCASSKDFVLYKKDEVKPVVYYGNAAKPAAEQFVSLFRKLGSNLSITDQLPKTSKPYIQLEINTKITGFHLLLKENRLSIIGATNNNLTQGIRHFFSNYTTLNDITINDPQLSQETVLVPIGLDYQSNAILTYKEPYFAENFEKEFRLWHNTNTLEETWGLWGHNIGKFIKVTPKMYAIIDGAPNEEQLNFSSIELQKELETAITAKLQEEPQATKFMIMPYDNEMVCQCQQCIKVGNTKTNASPAVYNLINKLAAKFPSASFFSTAYVSTENPPTIPMRSNVGVMISTMSFPKGVVLENSNKVGDINETFKNWQKLTKHIYLWDYAINFDNYFDAYPTVSIAQKNLQFYIKNGVTGIFMHGSDEGSFAAFGDLKAYLYAKLFNNPEIDIKPQVRLFLEKKYPSFGKALADYYLTVEETSLRNKRNLDIYGGIKNSVNKYLKQEELNKIFNIILSNREAVSLPNKKSLDLVLMSLVFQNLELLRTSGIVADGYATYENGNLKLNPEITNYLSLLKELSSTTGIEKYNEIGFTVSDYIKYWNTRIISTPYQNLLYQKQLKATSKLDEDYSDIKVLNNGTIGFQDYYNNWFLNSSATLSLEAATVGLEKGSLVQIDFLYDKKHKLYPPEKVSVYIGQRKYELVLGEKEEAGNSRKIVRAIIPIKINANDTTIRIEIKKQAENRKRSMACDEIIIK